MKAVRNQNEIGNEISWLIYEMPRHMPWYYDKSGSHQSRGMPFNITKVEG
jgi:hypothetical protein